MKTTKKTAPVLLAAGALVLVACGSPRSGASGAPDAAGRPTTTAAPLSFATAPPASVAGNVVSFELAARGVNIVPADGDTSGNSGHFHVFVDRQPPAPGEVIPKEAGIVHTADPHVTLAGLTVGPHVITVVLGDGAHHRLGGALLQADVTVNGPSVTATAPAMVAAGEPVPIDVHVEGLTLVPADGDTSGRSGHLHLFVDRPPTPAGQAIPKEDGIVHTAETSVSLPAMAPGEHTVWVVAGNGAHVPLDPPAMAKVTFTVAG